VKKSEQLTDNQIHIRFDGKSIDVSFGTLGIAPTASDADIRKAVSRFLTGTSEEVDIRKFEIQPLG